MLTMRFCHAASRHTHGWRTYNGSLLAGDARCFSWIAGRTPSFWRLSVWRLSCICHRRPDFLGRVSCGTIQTWCSHLREQCLEILKFELEVLLHFGLALRFC